MQKLWFIIGWLHYNKQAPKMDKAKLANVFNLDDDDKIRNSFNFTLFWWAEKILITIDVSLFVQIQVREEINLNHFTVHCLL